MTEDPRMAIFDAAAFALAGLSRASVDQARFGDGEPFDTAGVI
jgi:hypothetical protein